MSIELERWQQWIRDVIDHYGITQVDLAERAEVGERTVRKILGKQPGRPNATTLRAIERALGVPSHTIDLVMQGHEIPVESLPVEPAPEQVTLAWRVQRLEARLAEVERILRASRRP